MRDRRYRLRCSLGALLVLGCTTRCGAESEVLKCAELLVASRPLEAQQPESTARVLMAAVALT